jgi:hypothetical protein
MSINGIGNLLINNLVESVINAKDIAPDKPAQQLIEKASPSPISVAESPDYGRSNLMAGNYADPAPEKSKYLQATMKSFQTEKSFKNKVDSIVSLLKAGIDNKYAEGPTLLLKAKKHLQRLQNEEVVEESKEHLKNDREALAEAAQGDQAVLDANGNPLPETADVDSGSAPVSETETAAAPAHDAAAQVSVDVVI